MEFDPHGIFENPPWRARAMLEEVAAKANRDTPGDWRIPVRAVLDTVFSPDASPPVPTRKYRTKARPCACGCGVMITPDMRPGPPPKYVDAAHRKRAQRKRDATSAGVREKARALVHRVVGISEADVEPEGLVRKR